MRKLKFKTGIIIFSYSIFLVILLILFLFTIINISKNKKDYNKRDMVFFAENSNLTTDIIDGEIKVDINSAVNLNEIISFNNDRFIKIIILSVIILGIIIIFSNVLLFLALKKIELKRIMEILNPLLLNEDEFELKVSKPIIINIYRKIFNKFKNHINDFTRLNSYITHEIKNSLSLIRVKLELSGDKTFSNNIDKVSSKIDDILTLSSTNNIVELSPIDITLICAEVCDEYKKLYPNIEFQFDENAENSILAKEIWIYRAICNLIDNAIKYGNNGKITVCIVQNKGSIIITISDKGIGIDNVLQERIFDSGFRISNLKKDGYGIGLSLVRHVCDLCGGFCYLESELNVGSIFYLVFPKS